MITKEHIKNIIFIALATTLMGQVFINPFNSTFRLTLGIPVLVLLLLKFDTIPIISTNIVTAFSVVALRFSIDYSSQAGDVISLLNKHMPSAIFYIVFGIMLQKIELRRIKDQPFLFILLVGFCDAFSNTIEAFVRNEFISTSFETILTSLLITAFIRETVTFLLYSSVRFYNVLLLREENREKYKTFVMLTANMNSEILFLMKSMTDIEHAMARSYSIYNELKDETKVPDKNYMENLKRRILDIAKDIHELKKDNQRVVAGMEKLLPDFEKNYSLSLKEIFNILHENTNRYIKSLNKNIDLFVDAFVDIDISEYFLLISVLNNLINNAIDAIESEGYISMTVNRKNEEFVFSIIDTGCGIRARDKNVVFQPGYSTKYNSDTGEMSTGIGLTHVKHIVEDQFKGKITIESNIESGTKFTVFIPQKTLCSWEVIG
jgi:two-component system sensor histidine kinase YcbA